MDFLNDYAKAYDLSTPQLEYKYYHSIRVMDNMVLLARSLNLSIKDIEVARCIGILHDIGRFEQYKRYKSFSDFNLDHGDYGVTVLKETNALNHYNIDASDYETVYKAIRNHNKYKIESNLTNRELLFAKMIRDADKLDILYALSSPEIKETIKVDDSIISTNISKDFFNEELIKISKTSTINEKNVITFGYVYDINYKCILEIIKKKKYYEKIYERLKHKELFAPYLERVQKYLEERTD